MFFTMKSFLLASALLATSSGTQCSNNRTHHRLHGDRTLYEVVGGELPSKSRRAPRVCVPITTYMVVRHGARYPGADILPALSELLALTARVGESGSTALCDEDIQALRNWKVYTDEYDRRNITDAGHEEIRGVARRYKELFPEVLGSGVAANKFWFSSTDHVQTKESLISFKDEILRGEGESHASAARLRGAKQTIPPLSDDPVYSSSCQRYNALKRNKSATPEFNRFMAGPMIRRIGDNIAKRLGIRRSALTKSVIRSMYEDGCIYQQQVDGRNGPWCFVFTNEELNIMEFAFDVKNHELKGLGAPVSYLRNCFVAKDILSHLSGSRDQDRGGGGHLSAKMRIVHTTNIPPLGIDFGLLQIDEPPNADNYESQRNRTFRFSELVPTSGHLVFVLYRCRHNYKVQIFWNERVVHVPGCRVRRNGLCRLERFRRLYRRFVKGSSTECSQEEICALKDN